jgi:hypothetical protein
LAADEVGYNKPFCTEEMEEIRLIEEKKEKERSEKERIRKL